MTDHAHGTGGLWNIEDKGIDSMNFEIAEKGQLVIKA